MNVSDEAEVTRSEKLLVGYMDGSTRPNPGYSGYGIFAYTLVPSKRPNKTKHPIKNKLNFTSHGISEEKDTLPYETVDIVEYIGCLNTPVGTNNLAEMTAFIVMMKLAIELKVTHLKAFTDSNYVVLNFTDHLTKWKTRDWKRADGSPIAHRVEWELIDSLYKELTALGCKVETVWVKGHADDYGNEMADFYSVVGSNYARIQFEEKSEVFSTIAYSNISSYKDYKDSLADKDIVYYFRDLFFSSESINDTNYCFLSTSDNINEQGRRDTSSIFLTSVGFVPDLINKVKAKYRLIPRFYTANCCIKLNKLEDRELSRLARLVGIEKLLRPVTHNEITNLHLVKDNTPFVTEFNQEFPYITEVSRIFNNSLATIHTPANPLIKEVDVTDLFIKEGKIAFTNNDKDIDLTDIVTNAPSPSNYFEGLTFVNKLLATVGKDFPNYLALKSLENSISKVSAIVELRQDSSMATLYITIKTTDRLLCTVNITNKFLVRRK